MLFKNLYWINRDGTAGRGDLRVSDGRVAARGALTYEPDEEVLDCADRLVALPAFFNAHGHGAMTLLRGLGEDKALKRWLEEDIFPREAHLTPEMVEQGQRLAFLEGIQGGVAGFDEMYYYYGGIARAAADFGLKLARGLSTFGVEYPMVCPSRERIYLDPHAPYSLTLEEMAAAADRAGELNAGVRTHFLEAAWERDYLRETFGCTPVEYLRKTGLAKVKSLVLAHCVYLTRDEAAELADWGNVTAVHNPASNLKLASGFCPVAEFLEVGLPVALGTDGPASNNTLDPWREMQLASLLAKGVSGDPSVLNVAQTLHMAGTAGYEAFGFEAPATEPGGVADFAFVTLDDPCMVGADLETLPAFVAYSGHRGLVRHLMVDGRFVMRDRKTPLNEQEIMEQARQARRRLAEASGKKN